MLFWILLFMLSFAINRNCYFNIFLLTIIIIELVNRILSHMFFITVMQHYLYSLFIVSLFPTSLVLITIFSFSNSKMLMEKEGRKSKNLFITLLGIGAFVILTFTIYQASFPPENSKTNFMYMYITTLYLYFLGLYITKAIYTIIYVSIPPMYTPDYIVVLGSGLIDNRVPPLLASRLDEAVKQYKKYKRKPLLITSGGQGNDELVAEAVAMKQYIVKMHEVAEHEIIVEDKATNTYENMLFSKQIIDTKIKNARGIFVTNNFHVFRAGLCARKVGLKAIGIGAKTAFYYIPNAFMREFIGLLEMYKWWHIILLSALTIIWVLLWLFHT